MQWMNMPGRKFSLMARLSVLVTFAVLLVLTVLGFYFDGFLKDRFLDDTQLRMQRGYQRLAYNLKEIERELRDGISFIKTDEKFIASIDLINNYQDKDNYNTFLIDEEKKNIAAYLSAQVSKPGAAKNKDTVEMGKKIYRAGIAEKNVPACASCHGVAGAGLPVQYPRIGGQHQDYTAAQLTTFRTGARYNNAAMTTIAKRMSADEMKAVADYIAGMK